MESAASRTSSALAPGAPREAIVSAVLGPRRVRIDAPGLPDEATLAVPETYAPAVGDARVTFFIVSIILWLRPDNFKGIPPLKPRNARFVAFA